MYLHVKIKERKNQKWAQNNNLAKEILKCMATKIGFRVQNIFHGLSSKIGHDFALIINEKSQIILFPVTRIL